MPPTVVLLLVLLHLLSLVVRYASAGAARLSLRLCRGRRRLALDLPAKLEGKAQVTTVRYSASAIPPPRRLSPPAVSLQAETCSRPPSKLEGKAQLHSRLGALGEGGVDGIISGHVPEFIDKVFARNGVELASYSARLELFDFVLICPLGLYLRT